jgi:hypothetical protein
MSIESSRSSKNENVKCIAYGESPIGMMLEEQGFAVLK